jgi:hypothetical protein
MGLAKNVDHCFNAPTDEKESKGFFKRLFS